MRALIFNSGLGSRLGKLTEKKPKCLVRLSNGETILHRQLRILTTCGVREFVITTGPFADMVESEAKQFCRFGCSFEFVANDCYSDTNYIYSMWLARELLGKGDWLVLHGDLVFDIGYAQAVIDSEMPSLGSVNSFIPQPEKDFKARVNDGEVREVSVDIFDDDCVAFQPFYKLSEAAMSCWLAEVSRFVEAGDVGVYAENAANEVFCQMHVFAFSFENHFVEEVDTPEDLHRVSNGIRLFDFEQQPVFEMRGKDVFLADGVSAGSMRSAGDVAGVLSALGMHRPLVVTAPFFQSLNIATVLDAVGMTFKLFSDFSPNPKFEDVRRCLDAYREGRCDSLLSVGGGSAIDVAKCVKQLAAVPNGVDGVDLKASDKPWSSIPHVAVPTTAGTGSESTHFAVCYIDGEKVSVANDCLHPDAVLLDASNLAGLPDYQKKCTLLDALCQAIESYWSRRSTEASRCYSSEAIPLIMRNVDAYLSGDVGAANAMMRAANLAGKAINLTTTTAPHAMSYKLTSMFGIPHGHAVALCMPFCWRKLIADGDAVTQRRLAEIAELITGESGVGPQRGLSAFERMMGLLDIPVSVKGTLADIDALCEAVNIQRLANYPLELSAESIRKIYASIVLR